MTEGKKITESELILNPDGSIYHLNLRPEHVADIIILVGDPARVGRISQLFDRIEYTGRNREIVTHTGYFNRHRLSVISTGMGADNIDIVMNELDALVNIDLVSRTPKKHHTTLNIYRLGTSGAISRDVPVNAFILSEYGLGLDGILHFYKNSGDILENEMTRIFIEFTKWDDNLPTPYLVACSEKLASKFNNSFIRGITATAPGFYGPQGRRLRLPLANEGLNQKLRDFEYNGKRILNYEMETSALYGLGKLLGHLTLTLCIAIANRERHDFNQDHHQAIQDMIGIVLDTITQ
jgi:uridine phosphorylase